VPLSRMLSQQVTFGYVVGVAGYSSVVVVTGTEVVVTVAEELVPRPILVQESQSGIEETVHWRD